MEAHAPTLSRLHALLTAVKQRFVGKDEVVDVLALGLVAGQNVLLYGPPGTAKSALVSTLTRGITGGGGAFEYLLTRFTEPSELFGPFDLRRLREGELVTNTAGMLPEAATVFLDEVFNANSAILNSLLLALNERRFRRGQETRELPALLFAGASNNLPEDEALEALFDRFLLRVRCGAVDPARLGEVLAAGRALDATPPPLPEVDASGLLALQSAARAVDVSGASEAYLQLVADVRALGVRLSDRRAVKIQDLIAASALLSGRDAANASDLWVVRYVWDTDAQIAPLRALVDAAVQQAPDADRPHPTATRRAPDAEALAAEVAKIITGFEDASAAEQSARKDRLRHLADQLPWLPEGAARDTLATRVDEAWGTILIATAA